MNEQNMLSAADIVNMQAGGRSFIDKATDALTMGTAGAVVSGLGSIYNTLTFASNAVLGTEFDELDTAETLRKVDREWEMYYEENKGVIDIAGFIGGAFLPGGLAVKGLNMAKQGKVFGAFGRSLGFAESKQAEYLSAGLKQIANDTPSAFASMNRNKLLSMAYGTADNVLEVAVFESAALLTMARGPILADENWKDIGWDFVATALLGGGIGAGISAIWTNRIFRDAGKAVDKGARTYDTFEALRQMNLVMGDKAFGIIDELFKMPEEVLAIDKAISFSYKLNGKNYTTELDVADQFGAKLQANTKKAHEVFKSYLTNTVKSDPTVGTPFADAMLEILARGKKDQLTNDQIRQNLGDHLFNLERIQGLGSSPNIVTDVFYVLPGASILGSKQNKLPLMTDVRPSSAATAYKIIGNVESAKTGVIGDEGVGATLAEAWKNGLDIAYVGKEGVVKINPNSKIFVKFDIGESEYIQTTFNTRTKLTSDFPIATAADMATAARPLQVTRTGVTSGQFTFQFSPSKFEFSLDSIQNSARNRWADQVEDLRGVTLDARDFAMLDRAVELSITDPAKLAGTKIRFADDDINELGTVGLRTYVDSLKVKAAEKLFIEGAGKLDTRQLAHALNASDDWLDNLVKLEFDKTRTLKLDGSYRTPKSYSQRENIVLTYKKPDIADPAISDFPTGLLAYHHRVQLAQEQNTTAAANALGKFYDRFLDLKPGALKKEVDVTGTGAGGFNFANANYDDLGRVWAQDVGRAVHNTIPELVRESLDEIQPLAAKLIQDENLELGAVLQAVRFSSGKLQFIRTESGAMLVNKSAAKMYRSIQGRLAVATSMGKHGEAKDLARELGEIKFAVKPIKVSKDVEEFLRAFQRGHGRWIDKHKVLDAAKGKINDWDPEDLYVPPIDTTRVPFFAFVRARDGRLFADRDVAMITAKSADELQKKAASITSEHADLEVLFKRDTEDYFKAKGQFDMQSGMNAPAINSLLMKKGNLGDIKPTLEPKAVVEEFVRYIGKRESKLVRDAVQLNYADTFANLQWLSNKYTTVQQSAFKLATTEARSKVKDPFGDYMRTALDISKQSEFELWHQATDFVDQVGTKAYQLIEQGWREARQGKMTWEEANAQMERVGLKGLFTDQADYLAQQTGATDRNLIKLAVAKGNLLLSNITLRLDFANSLINIISMPLMIGQEVSSIRNSLKRQPDLLNKIAQMTSEGVPGLPDVRVPSFTRLMMASTGNYFGNKGKSLIQRYRDEIGTIRNDLQLHHEMMDSLALTPNMNVGKWAKNVNEWTEKGAAITGNNFAEQFSRFVASDVMRQITDPLVAAKQMSVKEQNAFISIFTNRVHGNYITSQRPIAFQGTIGAGIGLFQTYMFNLMQQTFRHIENRDARTLMFAAGMQTSIFGLNGLPAFDAINTHIIGNAHINEQHHDVYSRIASMDKEAGDALMFGLASAMPMVPKDWPSLFTRGDLNPRHITILPTSAANIPVVEATGRLINAVLGVGSQVAAGSDVSTALLHGLAHNGISRPLAGLATIAQGESTTSKGSLIAAHNDMISMASASRLLGAKPIDEAIALNHKFRMTAYMAADRERIENLGVTVKQKIRDGTLTDDDVTEFMSRYAASGGRLQGFSAAMQRWSKGANESVVNTMIRSNTSVWGQRMAEIMGGEQLPDFNNTPTEE